MHVIVFSFLPHIKSLPRAHLDVYRRHSTILVAFLFTFCSPVQYRMSRGSWRLEQPSGSNEPRNMPPKLSRLSRPTLLLASFSLAAQLYFMRQVHDFVLVLNGELPKPRTVHHATVVNSTLVEPLGLTEDGRNSISETNMKNKRRKRTKHKRSKKS